MTSDLPRVTIRVPIDIDAKLRYLADKSYRPLNMQILMILCWYLEAYENKYGEIKVDK